MFARFATRSTILLWGCVQLAACSHPSPISANVGLVTAEPGSGYAGFVDRAMAGLQECRRQTGATLLTAAPVSSSDYDRQLILLATENADAIIAVGPPAAADVERIARRFDKAHFVLIDGAVAGANVDSIAFDEPEGAFLAGALAAMVSKTGSVAFVGGVDAPLLESAEAGFAAGVREIDPRVKVRVRYVGSFDDRDAAKRQAESLFASGSDIVYVVAGPAGLGAIDAAKERPGRYIIGSDSDQDALAPGVVLTSVVKRIDAAAARACLETVAEKPESGLTVLGLANGGITLTDFTYSKAVVGEAHIERLGRIRDEIVAGRIVPPHTRAALATFSPAPVP
jgi:basic membrane protein A